MKRASFKTLVTKGINNLADATSYLVNGPIMSYNNFGFGLNLVSLKDTNIAIGMCGVLKRDELDHVDLGYALLPEFLAKGYAYEACTAVLENFNQNYGEKIVSAVTLPSNTSSNRLLKKLGFVFVCMISLYGRQNNYYEYTF